jgi:hypothetical protein
MTDPTISIPVTATSSNAKGRSPFRFIRRFWPHALSIISLTLLISVVSVLVVESKDTFPTLEAGTYAGELTNVMGGSTPVEFYVDRPLQGEGLTVAVLAMGWTPQVVETKQHEGSALVEMPLIVTAPNGRLKLVGKKIGTATYSGVVYDVLHEHRGSWTLRGLPVAASPLSAEENKLMVSLRAELLGVEDQIASLEAEVVSQKDQYDRLSAAVSDGDVLKSRATEKFRSLSSELDQAQRDLAQRQEQARLLDQKVELSRKLSPMGRLVSLARESLEREDRWADKVLGNSEEDSKEVREAIARGEKVLQLREQILREQRKLGVAPSVEDLP